MKCTGHLDSLMVDYSTNRQKVVLTVNEDVRGQYDKLKDCEKLSIEVKKYRAKRSLDANAYAWALMSKIAEVLCTDKGYIYEWMLREYGFVCENEYGEEKAITVLKEVDPSAYGIHVRYIEDEILYTAKAEKKIFAKYFVIKGSSEYDTKEMSYFIDRVIDEAKKLGIETLPPRELERMMSVYEKHRAT